METIEQIIKNMDNNLFNLDDKRLHKTDSVICLYCLKDWQAVYPENVSINNLECPNCKKHNSIEFNLITARKIINKNKQMKMISKETLEYNYRKFWIKKTKKQIQKEIDRLSNKIDRLSKKAFIHSSFYQNKDYIPTTEMSSGDEILNLREILELKSNIIIDKDGSSYHARFKDFKNLQESISGFGSTPKKAEKELYNNF